MNNNLTSEEFVSRYLENTLSQAQRLDFENKLLHDTELKEELDFQKDLVEGIKESRRLELKSRLSNIPINSPVYQSIGFKAIAVASITAGVGLGAYFYMGSDDTIQLTEIDLAENQVVVVDSEKTKVPDVPKAITPILQEPVLEQEESIIISQEKPKTEAVAKNTEINSEPKAILPNVIHPDVVDSFEDEDVDSKDITIYSSFENLDNIKEGTEETVEIATVKDKRNRFHYKFFENKLYLLGSFDDMPYEILELNSQKGKSYFLYYNDSFYKLDAEQAKPAPLVKIENDSLVNELKIIQSNQK